MHSTQCYECKHYLGGMACNAFTNKIPEVIAVGKFDHKKPYPGDNGIQFEPIDKKDDKK